MKQFVLALLVLAATASARPRFLVIPLEDVEFGDSQTMYNMNRRVARSAQEQPLPQPQQQQQQPEPFRRPAGGLGGPGPRPEGLQQQQQKGGNGNRREDVVPVPEDAAPPGAFLGAISAAGIKSATDSLAEGSSSYSSPPQGADYVDYGAYTGKKGAFGWYSDHPVLLYGAGYH